VGGKELLEVKVGDLCISWWGKKLLKRIVENNLTTVLRMLEALIDDVLVDKLGHLRTRDELAFWESQELPQLRCNFLFAVEAVVLGPLLGLLTIRVLLGVLDLADELGESLDVVAESREFGLNGFERHYIFLTGEIFKSMFFFISLY
jgi:hypothetical protein